MISGTRLGELETVNPGTRDERRELVACYRFVRAIDWDALLMAANRGLGSLGQPPEYLAADGAIVALTNALKALREG